MPAYGIILYTKWSQGKKLLATVTTLLIIVVNCVLVFFSSFLAAGGFGDASGVWTVQIIGFAWVAVASSAALSRCSKGNGSSGVAIAASTLPMAMVAVYILGAVWAAGQGILGIVEATPKEVTEICKYGGPKYLSVPGSPVHSIAFAWKTEQDVARFSYTNSNPRKFGRFRTLEEIEYPSSLYFIERQFAAGLGVRSDAHWPYMRMPNGGVFEGATELTADALVFYEYKKLSKADARNVFWLTDITVVERRTGRVLASLQYPTEGGNTPICGETSPGEMNIAEFIFKAIKIPSN